MKKQPLSPGVKFLNPLAAGGYVGKESKKIDNLVGTVIIEKRELDAIIKLLKSIE